MVAALRSRNMALFEVCSNKNCASSGYFLIVEGYIVDSLMNNVYHYCEPEAWSLMLNSSSASSASIFTIITPLEQILFWKPTKSKSRSHI
jgi:hypothetical protein